MRRPLEVARKRQRGQLGPAVPVVLNGLVHWGWFVTARFAPPSLITACGFASACCRDGISTRKVNCRACQKKAKADPATIRGKR